MTKIKLFSLKKQDFINNAPSSAERGSAIIWILVMIALFAALNYTISQGSRGGAATISKEKAALAATEILEYASAHKRAVQTLQINGCDETEISFETPDRPEYANANAPTDNSCHVYHINGGGLRYQEPKEEWMDINQSAQNYFGTWHVTAVAWLDGLGTDGTASNCVGGAGDGSCHELLTGLPYLKLEVCKAINKKMSWGVDQDGTPIKDSGGSYGAGTGSEFDGNFVTATNINMGIAIPSGNNYSNTLTGCIEGNSSPPDGAYSFFQVLIVR